MTNRDSLKQSEFFRAIYPGLPQMPVANPVWHDAGLRVQNRVRGIDHALRDAVTGTVWKDKP